MEGNLRLSRHTNMLFRDLEAALAAFYGAAVTSDHLGNEETVQLSVSAGIYWECRSHAVFPDQGISTG